MASNIEGVANTSSLTQNGKSRTATSGKHTRSNSSENREAAVETAHTIELSPESVSKAQKIVTGNGYITSNNLGDIDLTDEQALELSTEIARQMENLARGLIQPPSAELAGMVG
ncbi:MAG: hypothetical protein GY697_08135 [Desulfobacterales bacterium]|nr:hypothetical protein [Desulfobacterales bacterium]